MSRPPRQRHVAQVPPAPLFKPAGVPARLLQSVHLTIDEVEALRLADFEGLSQEQAAASMGVARQTVGRVLETARRKVADALVNGKALVIGGGAYRLARARWCSDCGHRWWHAIEAPEPAGRPSEQGQQGADVCPQCSSVEIREPDRAAGWGDGWRHRHGRGGAPAETPPRGRRGHP